jgi:hypothetical protein
MEQRFVSVRLLAVWTPFRLHLENAHFNAKLDLPPAVVAVNPSDAELL